MNDSIAFKDHFSAFLSVARSPLQYIFEVVKLDPSEKKWDDDLAATKPLIRFFKGKRDINIHARPVPPKVAASMEVERQLVISEVPVRTDALNISLVSTTKPVF